MSERSEKLSLRRQALQTKIQAQRQLLQLQSAGICQRMAISNLAWQAGGAIIGQLRQKPWLGAIAGVATVFIGPERLLSGVRSGLRIWRLWRDIAPAFRSSDNKTTLER